MIFKSGLSQFFKGCLPQNLLSSLLNTVSINPEALILNMKVWAYHGLIRKEKAHINCEKGAQINILANKISTKWWPNIIIKDSKQTIHYIWFYFLVIMFILCCWFDKKKLELRLMVVLVLLKMKFGHAQISVPKIGIPMSKTACINPCVHRTCVMEIVE